MAEKQQSFENLVHRGFKRTLNVGLCLQFFKIYIFVIILKFNIGRVLAESTDFNNYNLLKI